MPPVPGRPYPVDLWLCGHHYRTSLEALSSAGALTGFIGDAEGAFVPEAVARTVLASRAS